MSATATDNNVKRRKPANLIYGLDDLVPGFTCLLLGLQHSFYVTTALIFAMIVIQAMAVHGRRQAFLSACPFWRAAAALN